MSGRVGMVIGGLVLAAGTLVLLAVVGVGGWFMLGSSGSGDAGGALDGGLEALDAGSAGGAAGDGALEQAPLPAPALTGGDARDGGAAARPAAAPEAGTAVAAGVVQAVVLSKRTEQPLEGAVLRLVAKDAEEAAATSEATGAEGRIELSGVAAGDYTVRVERPGCAPFELAGFAMASGTGRDLGVIHLVPTPAVQGRVTRLDGSAAQGATVELVNEVALEFGPNMSIMDLITDLKADEVLYARVNADAEGRYTIWWDQVLPGDFAMRAAVAESATEHRGVTLSAEAAAERDFQLGKPVVLAGTVLDHAGNPCTGCRIIAVPEPDQQMLVGGRKMMIFKNVGVVNATGAFRFDQLTAGRYMLFAGGGVYTQKMIQNVTVPKEDYEIRLARGITLRGRVTDARTGDPIAGAKVAVGGPGGFDVGATDAEGRYEFTGIAGKGLDLFVEAAGYPGTQRNVPQGGDRTVVEFDLQLDPGLILEGRVVSAGDRRGVPGATVLVLTSGAGFTPGGVPRAESDADGRFVVRGVSLDPRGMGRVEVRVNEDGRRVEEPRTYDLQVVAVAPGYAIGKPFKLKLREGEQPAPFEVPLLVAARVQGRVTDGAGKPVAGAVVSWSQRKPADAPDQVVAGFDSTPMMLGMLLPDQTVKSGADGRFLLTDVRPGAETIVTAKHAKLAAVSSAPFATEGGKPSDCPDLKLSSGATLVVVAAGPGGTPAPGQQIQLEPDFSQEDLASGRVNPMEVASSEQFRPRASGPDGRVVYRGLAKGTYTVHCRGPLVASKVPSVKLGGSGEETVELSLVEGLSIEGIVLDPQGGVPKQAWLWAERVGASGSGNQSVGNAQIDTDGKFRFDALAPGLYRISGWSDSGGRADAVEVQAGQTGVTIQFKSSK